MVVVYLAQQVVIGTKKQVGLLKGLLTFGGSIMANKLKYGARDNFLPQKRKPQNRRLKIMKK